MKYLISGILLFLACQAQAEKVIVCYVGTWATYRTGNGKFDVSDIDPTLCTHLTYSFFGIRDSGEFNILDSYLDLEDNWGRGNIKKFNALKEINPNLKTLAAVGGWNEGSYKFSQVAKDPTKRQRFITTSVQFLLKHGFNGLDMDWEYPAQRDGDPTIDRENFSIFMRELKQELVKHNLLLTAAVACSENNARKSYNIPEIAKSFDLINVMAYDLHGSFDAKLGMNAPLFSGPADVTEIDKQLNLKSSIDYWLNQGAIREKLILGLPLYGRSFTLQNSQQNTPGSVHSGPGTEGPYTKERGMLGYNEICELFKSGQWTKKWEDNYKVPYAFNGNQWISYDDEKSLELKVRFAMENNLGGVMVWSLETDDFKGICGSKYPLMNKIKQTLGSNTVEQPPSPITNFPPLRNPEKPTEPPSYPDSQCGLTENRMYRDAKRCSAFHMCSNGQIYNFECPASLMFDSKLLICNYANAVDCTN